MQWQVCEKLLTVLLLPDAGDIFDISRIYSYFLVIKALHDECEAIIELIQINFVIAREEIHRSHGTHIRVLLIDEPVEGDRRIRNYHHEI